ncbi:MAG: hemerythrin family protein [Rubrivivax sp.]|nr:hemerythrin family protein [Rubrivivax sp.]
MPGHAPWEPGFETGHDVVDAQHRDLLERCERLAETCGDVADGARFDEAFEQLKAAVREHLQAEAALLASLGDPDADALRDEHDEFDDLAAEILTTANFDRLELQRFVAVWCLGHVTASAAHLRAWLGR